MIKRAVAGAAVFAASTLGAVAQEGFGQSEFMVACAICHGESGAGNGPFAEVLNIEVPGLTGLAAAHNGVFPFSDTLRTVDGRNEVRAHGGPMPVWGDRFATSAEVLGGPYSPEAIARGRLLALVYYIESIQE